MKTARIGTILPWGGDGNEGFTASNIPKGWKVCDGQVADAFDYPLLFSEIGNTYGGTGLAKRHTWYVGISASPLSIGSKTSYGLYVSLEYL